jgi:hypothetical protein
MATEPKKTFLRLRFVFSILMIGTAKAPEKKISGALFFEIRIKAYC